jgi:(R)-2-hydroxyacyl-CoA dehydratese activating ATPase
MLTAGLDLGSRTIALVEWDGCRVVREEVVFTGTDPLARARELIAGHQYDHIIATGYGRHLVMEKALTKEVITEIKAFALGAHYLFPEVGTVLDIGGQDSKVIQVNSDGGVAKFEMNDRCAAGTGRFLENMALALNLAVEKLGEHALAAQGQAVKLSSMCAVFAESEVVSLIGRGADSRQVALGIHQAIVSRVAGMVRRVGLKPPLVFAGGVANNPCMQITLAAELGITPLIPANPQTTGALGAALRAAQKLG